MKRSTRGSRIAVDRLPLASSGPRAGRRGAVLIVAIVAIAVATVVFMSTLRLAVAEREALQSEAWRAQAAWLVESGLERAAARLAADPQYQGETWRVAGAALGSKLGAVVQIEVQPLPDQPQRRSVHVRADYPDHPQRRARQSKQVVIEVRPSSQEGAGAESLKTVPGSGPSQDDQGDKP